MIKFECKVVASANPGLSGSLIQIMAHDNDSSSEVVLECKSSPHDLCEMLSSSLNSLMQAMK